jgi:hypothetical protein
MIVYQISLKQWIEETPQKYWNILNSSNRKVKAGIDIDSMFEFM